MSVDWKKIIEKRLNGLQQPDIPLRIQVPRPPQCVAEFISCADNPAAPLQNLGGIIEKDSEIASSVLRIVNGSQLMLKEKISSVSRAIGILGVQRCKMLVMSAAIQSTINGGNTSTQHASEFLAEAQMRSLFARSVAEILKVDGDIAYIAALLQDLALPQLLNVDSQAYAAFHAAQGRLVDFECSVMEWDHSLYTAALLSKWNFAQEVIACVSMHHQSEEILNDKKLLNSELAAVTISGLLPGVMQQEPEGIERLLEFQRVIPDFDLLEVATDVDEQLANSYGGVKSRVSLADRLSRLAVAALGNKTRETNWIERTVGSYTLEEKLGQGGMGVVYRARHSMLRRPAAVKMLKTSTLSAQVLEQFEIEAHITSELSSPHTVQVYDYGISPEGELYYVMEFLQGMSLAEVVSKYGPLPEERIIHILCQVCGSLAEAHTKGLVHRDIKPDNIAITVCAGTYDFAKVLDFGLVAVKDEIPELASANKLFGTPAYMAPEAIQALNLVDERTDIYALGAVAYFCLTGKPLFHGMNLMDVLRAQINLVPEFPVENASLEMIELIMACLEKSKSKRPQSVMAVAEAMSRSPKANSWSYRDAQDWWERKPVLQKSSSEPCETDSTVIGGILPQNSTRIYDQYQVLE